MGILDETRFVERLQFFDGQRLFAADLQGLEAFHREMRELHNLSLHQPGIGNGFAVTGKRDDREVRVGPGYATDALGREIVLTREQVEPVPPVAGESDGTSVFFDLVVSHPDDASLEVTETRQGICLPRGVVRRREEPVLCWIRLQRGANDVLQPADPVLAKQIQDNLRIVLARVEVIDCKLRQTVSLAERRGARPARLPFLACGETAIDEGDFEELDITTTSSSSGARLFHLKRKLIDTRAAGFQTAPCYSVRLDRQRFADHFDDGSVFTDYIILDSSVQVFDPKPGSFTIEALLEIYDRRDPPNPAPRGAPPPGPEDAPPPSLLSGWKAVWMGVE